MDRKRQLKKQPAPARKKASDRVRAVRSDRGGHHNWSDGREKSAIYKLNKKNNVKWSEVRCREATCWKTNTRKTDKKGVGSYKVNLRDGHYKGQLRRKARPGGRGDKEPGSYQETLRSRGILRAKPRKRDPKTGKLGKTTRRKQTLPANYQPL